MKEAVFIRQNMAKWHKLELVVDDQVFSTSDELVEAYINVTSDLAFARTHFPDSQVTTYLNNLALALHRDIYSYRSGRWRHALRFWSHDIPLAVYDSRREIIASMLFFFLSYLIGVLSTFGDPGFPDFILGSGYMDMTRQNIEAGIPMGVYGSEDSASMFLSITLNNVFVAFRTYVVGIFTSFFTGLMLLYNGVMIGTFQTFFYQQNLLGECLMATMLHGTFELTAITIAGGAGFVLGNGWLFPGTYSRTRSFLIAGRRSVRVLVSTLPIFVVAGFIESFITRYTHVGDVFRLLIIGLSILFLLFYYVFLPLYRHRNAQQ